MCELLLVAPHTPACFWSLHLRDGRLGNADDQATKHSQNQSRISVAHATPILIQGNVQRVVEPAFNDPVAPLELNPIQCVHLLQS